MTFENRADAGRQLAQALRHLRDRALVVFGLPRGGVVTAFEVAMALEAPLDVILVRKIGVPQQPELAAGAVVDGEDMQVVVNDDVLRGTGVSRDYVHRQAERELGELERRRQLYVGTRERVPVAGRTAIVVDDGIATGATMRAALLGVRRRQPAHLVLAVPVAPPAAVAALRAEVDEVVCLRAPAFFGAVGAFYDDFRQVSDDEVRELLARAARRQAAPAPQEGT